MTEKNKKLNRVVILISFLGLMLIVLSGCGTKFSCVETIEGIMCTPPSKVYEQITKDKVLQAPPEIKKAESEKEKIVQSLNYGVKAKPIRVPPKVIKIWIAPWEDSDGDLHRGEEIFSEITPAVGRWIIGERDAGVADVRVISSSAIEDLPSKSSEKEPQGRTSRQKSEVSEPENEVSIRKRSNITPNK